MNAEATSDTKRGRPRAALWAGSSVIVLSLLGLANAASLALEHYSFHTDPTYSSFCEISEGFTCKTVALSPWSVILGLPVAAWGIVGTVMLGLLGLWLCLASEERSRAASGALLALSLGAVGTSVGLITISTFLIHALCPLCLVAHLLNLSTATIAIVAARKLGGVKEVILAGWRFAWQSPSRMIGAAAPAAMITVCLAIAYPPYWAPTPPAPRTADLPTGVTQEGVPWIGAEKPEITVVEYSDYQCPHCRRAHHETRKLVANNPQCVRLVHCQFPLDQQCNPAIARSLHNRACDLACMAFCAAEQNRFWEANDYLFECDDQDRISAASLAQALNLDQGKLEQCLSSERPHTALRRDLEEAASLGIRGTPTYVVEGQLYPGRLPEHVLQPRQGRSTTTPHDG